MLPGGILSTTVVSGAFTFARSKNVSNVVDYVTAGVDFNDPSEGLLYQTWRARVLPTPGSSDTDDIIVDADEVAASTVYSAADITEVSISFDRNMRLYYAWVEAGVAYLRWYDSVAEEMTTTNLGSSVITPRLVHDDKRELQSPISDIILAYIENGNLYYKQQRDRYETAYLLKEGVASPGIVKIGFNEHLRLQFCMRADQ